MDILTTISGGFSLLKSVLEFVRSERMTRRIAKEQGNLLRNPADNNLRVTNILFPWVANVSGYDTGFAIANTTSDIFGTASQSGTCTYNFFGKNTPQGGTFTTATVNGGCVDTQLLSKIAPGFAGYVIVQCNFEHAHGTAMLTNGFGGGPVTVSHMIEGRIIPKPEAIGKRSI